MKVKCINDCQFQGRLFQQYDPKYKGIYNVTLKEGEKLHPCLEEIKAPAAPAAKGKKSEKAIADEL